MSAQPTAVPALLNAIAPGVWSKSAHLITGQGRRVLDTAFVRTFALNGEAA